MVLEVLTVRQFQIFLDTEGATQTAVQEIVDLTTICRQPLKKEGTPDSDVVFKTAPNTPILSRIPVINIIELPSITEDSSNITRQNDNTSFNKQSSTETKSTNYSNCDKNLIFDTDKPQVELNNNKDKRSVQSEGSSSNNDMKKTEANSCEIKEKQTPLHNSDNKSNEAQNNELITKLKNTNIKMAEIAECSEMNNDTIIHKDVIPFADSDGDDEDISQETSRSETSNSVYHDKSSSYSEKTNQNSIEIKTDENTNSLNHHKETYLNMKNTTNDTGNIKTECNNLLTVNDRNKSNKTVIFKEQINTGLNVENENKTENSESSRETEDEASDSEMEYKEESTSAEDKKETEEEEDDNDEEVEEIEEEEEETIEEEGTFEEKQNKNDRAENTLHVESNLVESDGINKDGIQEEDCKGSHNDEQDEEEEDDSEEEEDENEDNIRGQEIKEEENVEILQQATELKIKENLVNIESKADRQISDLQTELKQSEKEINNLKIQVGDLQREVIVKSSGMDRLQAELTAAYKESECVRKKLKRLEEDLDCFKQKNSDLTDELNRKTESESENDYWKVIELENEVKEQTQRIKDLENQLSVIRQERDKLAQSVAELTEEREEERKIVQEALDEAMAEKTAVQEKFEREFERLRTENSDREQKMLDDFEWKLREVESACKKRLDDKEQSSQQHIREIEGKLNIAEGKLAQLPHLKQCEQELQQLREKSIEQTRALRTATRQAEQHQNVEKLLQDEIQHLKTLLEKEKAHLATVQSIHNREVSEKDRKLQFKLEQQKNELNSEWEDKLKRDTQKIKTDLERIFRNEKQLALEEAKQQHEHKLRQLKSTWEKKHEDGVKEIDNLKHKLSEKEDEFKKELETAQTSSDRDIFELRRKLDKIDISYQEKIEKMQEKHDKEIERITEEAERKLQQCELNWQQQVGSSRTTIELVKEQMQREAQEQLQALSEHHRRQLEEQWDQLIQERDETISLMEQKHRASMEKLRGELDAIYKSRNSRETERRQCYHYSYCNSISSTFSIMVPIHFISFLIFFHDFWNSIDAFKFY
ncbi:uncharacterized protein LOC142324914 isoform X9 [Lycorma delicatula]|uniref:uncharacterized protein LOC142324914 isoform X9 n=1 Tax=Lycorma delicatula TaxID=130591 RepID=UPI003F50D69D